MFQKSRVVRQALASVAVLGSVLLSAPSQAADDGSWQQVKKAGVLRCGAAVSTPWVMRDPKTGEYSGPFPELCRNFGQDVLKVKVEFVDTSWDNIVAGLQSEKWDISLSLNDTPERRKAISFSIPVTDYSVNFTYNKKNPKIPKNIHTIADIDKPDVTVTVMSGTAQDKAISAVLSKAKIMRLPGFDETRLALMSKRADMLADDSATNALLVYAHPDWAAAFTPTPLLASQSINLGIRKETPEADAAVLNQYIEQQKSSGNLAKLIDAGIKASAEPSK